jgi:hypothetical protein
MRMNISVPDTLAAEVRKRDLPISAICQRALSAELERLKGLERASGDMEKITVEVGEPSLTVGFTGRWLVYPDPDETRFGDDAGAYWGVALTQRGRIAVYVAHVNDGWAASLNDYSGLDAAAGDDVPEEIIARAAAELGETRVLWRDI